MVPHAGLAPAGDRLDHDRPPAGFQREGLWRTRLEQAPIGAEGFRTDQDLAGTGMVAKPGSNIRRLPEDLVAATRQVAFPDHHDPRMYAGMQRHPASQPGYGGVQFKRRLDRAADGVFLGSRIAEDIQETVTIDAYQSAAVPVYCRDHIAAQAVKQAGIFLRLEA